MSHPVRSSGLTARRPDGGSGAAGRRARAAAALRRRAVLDATGPTRPSPARQRRSTASSASPWPWTDARPAARWSVCAGARTPAAPGVYLDGGFGVGKTHLLASLWHAAPTGPKAFGTFVELTNLVGALGFQQPCEALSRAPAAVHRRVRARRPRRHRAGVHAAGPAGRRRRAGSPPPPTRCPASWARAGSPRTTSCARSRALSAHFDVLRIDGEDYRHRGLPEAPAAAAGRRGRRAALRPPAGAHARRLRRPARAPGDGAPEPLRRPDRRRRRAVCLHGRAAGAGPERRAAARGAGRPALRPRRPGRSPPARRSTSCSARRCCAAATARSTSGRSPG